ncbi:MAG: cytochrome c biogenesis protein CcsA [Bacteroidota bacterium]
MMAKHWWKVLSIVILFYTFTVGMLIPLRPGILEVRPSRINTGEQVQLEVWGYNTRFKEGERELRAWLKLEGDYAIEANNLLIKAENYMILGFEIPAHLPVETKVADASLIIDNKVDGASVRPSAVFISQSSINQAQGKAAWRTPINNLHQSKDIHFPFRNILAESIRNTYFHVPFWFAMILIFLGSMVYSVLYLMKGQNVYDMQSVALTEVGIVFGLIGLITGGVWAQYTWGSFWSFDVKQNMSAISLLIYMAYFVLRQSFEDEEKKARISAVYNIFALHQSSKNYPRYIGPKLLP